ncbi:MAG: YolD-like family protein [Ruminococcaceae bacterium]|nr:YolD-like family protein [Oscillospiraceae bacterium]
MADNYKDIINLPHHTSETRQRMSQYNRAAQFSPFAALTGYDEAVRETARYTEEKTELDEYQIAVINDKLNVAMEKKDQSPILYITCFKPDSRKKGGEYITVAGTIRKIDEVNHSIVLSDGTSIPIQLIYDIDGDVF